MKLTLLFVMRTVAVLCVLAALVFGQLSSSAYDALMMLFAFIGFPVFLTWVLLREIKRRKSQEALLQVLLQQRQLGANSGDAILRNQADKGGH